MKDPYWNEVAPQKLPYTVASEGYQSEYPTFSTTTTNIKESEQAVIQPNGELVRHRCALHFQFLK